MVERCHVSVRTIQRIESGEVIPRVSTIKILCAALDENFESFAQSFPQNKHQKNNFMNTLFMFNIENSTNTVLFKNAFQMAAIAGAVYLFLEVMLIVFDVAWLHGELGTTGHTLYVIATLAAVVSFFTFMRGFLVFGHLFENGLLKIGAYIMIIGIIGVSVLDIYSLFYLSVEALLLPYSVASVIIGSMGIVFGVGLLKLQDGMGQLAKVVGILEIILGFFLITVVLFFISYAIMIPTVILEIILLYNGYEYLNKQTSAPKL
ncbi:MAG: helix-turn-helix transcriptional regulator [Flammeovirgaceae bacterium]|nr:helix-turn-helix transcriptional regulator [Flammeovirgaceae bacterium]